MLVDVGVDEIFLCNSGFIDVLLSDPQLIALWHNYTRHAEQMGGGGDLWVHGALAGLLQGVLASLTSGRAPLGPAKGGLGKLGQSLWGWLL